MAYTNIDFPAEYFNTKLYTGNGSTQSITGVGFQPNMTWIKNRGEAVAHVLFDNVRGAGGNKELTPNQAYAEGGNATISYGFLSSFDSDGFSVSNGTSSPNQADYVNKSSINYTSWNWLAGGTAVSNTAGSITSTVSANTTSGFSIVSYTGNATSGATVGHGLGSTPAVVLVKSRSIGQGWVMYHKNLTSPSYFLGLNYTDAETNQSNVFSGNAPTSSTFYIGASGYGANNSGATYIAYCFAEVKGFSKFGSYTGNGSTDGTFVYTGFKPAWVMVKGSSFSGENWEIYDNKRNTFNTANTTLKADAAAAESTNSLFNNDFLSNGFKLRNSHTGSNQSGSTYIYMAFADNPFVSSKGIPTTAR